LRALIIDDHPVFAEGLRILLESSERGAIEVVGMETQAAKAVDAVRRHDPDLAIVDIAMPPPGGLAVIGAIVRHYPQVRVLALSGVDQLSDAEAALRAGAMGFLPKTARLDDMLRPMEAVVAGWTVLPKSLLDHLLDRATTRQISPMVASMPIEQRCLWKLIAQGKETAEIASELYVSERTAKRQVSVLLRTVGASNRTEAAALAGRLGLLEDDETSTA
jgi:DNA-binding NarL/FixJ family response regulator